ncbi:MAG: hypothetical protein P4M11_12785 [Candidatus Pacebacteria bacterium]|nr:hypothetical protein [Candidatus Paceibacterota bacterium]
MRETDLFKKLFAKGSFVTTASDDKRDPERRLTEPRFSARSVLLSNPRMIASMSFVDMSWQVDGLMVRAWPQRDRS